MILLLASGSGSEVFLSFLAVIPGRWMARKGAKNET